ncbi:MAG: cytochrome ubiquinol oxidase subunit I [Proteobacteria bacterium]|nr:cytochrome ubiquinol oxidase subunit I [Pseudomonadota bacterium]
MNYPVWQLDFAGGGLLIAVMAILHVYVSHFAVGGGLFLVLTEHKGIRENNPAILAYVQRHTKFFMLLTMVFGSLTGVGIWFTISLLNPAATSVLIHNFVFAWAAEWTLFVAEIVAIFLYYYSFGRISSRQHLIIGWIYFACAWLSLFVINGIIDFMLTPGSWLENGSFWSGLFNPTFWPALFFRTFLAVMIAGLFGFMTATAQKEPGLRHNLVRFCALWLLAPFVFLLASAWWYRAALPPQLEAMVFDRIPGLQGYMRAFIVCSPLLILGGLLMAVRTPSAVRRSLAVVMLIVGLIYIGAFEFIREGGRKPYIIQNYMYANSLLKEELPAVQQVGILKSARWAHLRKVEEDKLGVAGQEIFNLTCLSCHSIGGPLRDMRKRSAQLSIKGLEFVISAMGEKLPYMPPFAGTDEEKEALIFFLHRSLLNQPQAND